jgi:hypothetical protein
MRDRVFVILGAIIASFLVDKLVEYRESGASPQAHVWHDAMIYSQKAASRFGQFGLYAERRYYEEVEAHAAR